MAAAGQNASGRGYTALVQMKNDSQTCDRRPTADGMLLAYSPFGAAIESRRPLLRPPHRHPRPPTSQGDPARADAALPRRCGGASALVHSLAHSLRVTTLRTAAAGLIVAALTVPGTAQTKGLKKGLYVIDQYPCNNFPPPAALYFDGATFGYKTVKCALQRTPGSASDAYTSVCMEGSDASTRDEQKWTFRKVSSRSFSINGSTFRFCSVDP